MKHLIKYFGLLFLLFAFHGNNAHAQCQAEVGPQKIFEDCGPLTIQFNSANSTGALTRTWDFGDGSPTVGTNNPTHTYSRVFRDTTYIGTLTVNCSGNQVSVDTFEVTVKASPEVSFSLDRASLCAVTDTLCTTNNQPFNPNYTYSWEFGDNTTSNEYEPCKVYLNNDEFQVRLTITDTTTTFNCQNRFDTTITVNEAPNPDFETNTLDGCTPLDVNFTNSTSAGTSPIVSWSWDFDDGRTSDDENPGNLTFDTSGVYTINLTATNATGCFNFITKSLSVRKTPTSTFELDTNEVCPEDPVVATYTGDATPAADFNWDFDNEATLSGTNEGPYTATWGFDPNTNTNTRTITLIVIENDCPDTTTQTVSIIEPEELSFTKSVVEDSICINEEVAFTALPPNFSDYSFRVNGNLEQSGTSNVFEYSDFNDGDTVRVSAIDQSGCNVLVDTFFIFYLRSEPNAILTALPQRDTICVDESVTFRASSQGFDRYDFYVGAVLEQSSSVDSFNLTNVRSGIPVSVIGFDQGCEGDRSNEISKIVQEPLPSPQPNCGVTTFTSVSFVWDEIERAVDYEVSLDSGQTFISPNGTLSHEVTGLNVGDTVSIIVRALGDSICGDSDVSRLVTCFALDCEPMDFNLTADANNICEGDSIAINVSNVVSRNPDSVFFFYNDGDATRIITKEFTLLQDTVLEVRMIDSSQVLCPPTLKTVNIRVNDIPQVSLSAMPLADTICENETVVFEADPQNFDNYEFFDGNVSVQSSFDPTFETANLASNRPITVIATNNGCESEVSNGIAKIIKDPTAPPVVSCGRTTDSTITFTWDEVPDAQGYEVSFNNGNTFQAANGADGLSHDVVGLNNGESRTIVVRALSFGVCGNTGNSVPVTCSAIPCEPINYDFDNELSVCDGDTLILSIANLDSPTDSFSIQWGETPVGREFQFEYIPTVDTLFPVAVRDSSQLNCPATTKFVNITVNEIPNVSLLSSEATDTICENESVTFTAEPAGFDNYIFFVGFDEQQNSNDPEFVPTNLRNNRPVTVMAQSAGCEGPVSNEIEKVIIDEIPTPQVNCGRSTTESIEFVWNAVADANDYEISLDGGITIISPNGTDGLSHEVIDLNPDDSLTIMVRALGDAPCNESEWSEMVTCYAIDCEPIGFDVDTEVQACEGDSVTLTLSNIVSVDGNFEFSWNDGPATLDSVQSYLASQPLDVDVRMIDQDQANCPNYRRTISIETTDKPLVNTIFVEGGDTLCHGDLFEIRATPGIFDRYLFFVEDSLFAEGENPVFRLENNESSLNISILAEDFGCVGDTFTQQVEVLPPLHANLEMPTADSLCFGDSIVLNATAGLENYDFYRGENIFQSGLQSSITFLAEQDEFFFVEVTDRFGCMGFTDTQSVNVIPPVNLAIEEEDGLNDICQATALTLIATPGSLVNYQFYDGENLLQDGPANVLQIDSAIQGDRRFWVRGETDFGCPSNPSDTLEINVRPLPLFALEGGDTICINDEVNLTIIPEVVSDDIDYLWRGIGSPELSISDFPGSSRYYVASAELNGCVFEDSAFVLVDTAGPPDAVVSGERTFCLGDSVTLQASGGLSYRWEPETGLSNPNIAEPNASPSVTTDYDVIVTGIACETRLSTTLIVDRCLSEIVEGEIPQIITPNGDGQNDEWHIPDIDYFENNTVKIFNRYGSLVFEKRAYDNGGDSFDGTGKNGENLPDGTYYYVIDLGNGEDYKGFIMIQR